MSLFTTTSMAMGVVLSALSGLVCYLGTGLVAGHLDWLPQSQLFLSHPGAFLGAGATMIVIGMLCHPTRIQ